MYIFSKLGMITKFIYNIKQALKAPMKINLITDRLLTKIT